VKIRKNIGTADRMIRMAAGTAALVVAALAMADLLPGWGVLGLVGVFPLLFGAIGYCPRHALLGIDTSRTQNAGDGHYGRVR